MFILPVHASEFIGHRSVVVDWMPLDGRRVLFDYGGKQRRRADPELPMRAMIEEVQEARERAANTG